MTTTEDLDFSAFTPTPATGDLKALGEMVQRAAEIQAGLKKLEERSKVGEQLLKDLLEVQIPELMAQCGMTVEDKVTFNGVTLQLKSDVYCNVPAISSIEKERDPDKRRALAQRRDRALAYLEQEAPALIKRKYEIEFDKGDTDGALSLESKLAEMDNPPELVKGLSVHPQTLAKWVKEKQSTGFAFPTEIQEALGIFPKQVAKITK